MFPNFLPFSLADHLDTASSCDSLRNAEFQMWGWVGQWQSPQGPDTKLVASTFRLSAFVLLQLKSWAQSPGPVRLAVMAPSRLHCPHLTCWEMGDRPGSPGPLFENFWLSAVLSDSRPHLQLFLQLGNGAGNRFWAANVPPSEALQPSSSPGARRHHLEAKYREGKYRRYHPLFGNQEELNKVSTARLGPVRPPPCPHIVWALL